METKGDSPTKISRNKDPSPIDNDEDYGNQNPKDSPGKEIEKDLMKSESMLKMVINSIPQFIFWKDRNSVYQG